MKITVIGAGPGGYVTAIRAAQLGAQVSIIEKENVGGTCLNVGCIPTKALLHAADAINTMKEGRGLVIGDAHVDWKALQKRKGQVVRKLVKGVAGLLAANGVSMYSGSAVIKDAHTVVVGEEEISSDIIIIATGSSPAQIPFEGADLPDVIDSTAALSLEEVPQNLAILGGGVIGCEFGYLYNSLGAKVSIIEMMPEILPPIDNGISQKLREALVRQGIKVYTSSKLTAVSSTEDGMVARLEDGTEIPCDKFLVSIGRKANTEGLGLEALGIEMDRGKVVVNDDFRTNVENIYAIGDCNGRTMLAHAASAQGEYVVDKLMGLNPSYNADLVPSCIYTKPQVAAVGLTEEEAQRRGISYKVGAFPLSGNGKALIEGSEMGIVKLMEDESGRLIGAHMIGSGAVDLSGEMAVALSKGMSAKELAEVMHAHPTVSEAIREAALDVNKMSIHWPPGVPTV
ncbi:MAG: dihydrolipoyl dehydrogenase [Clostridiales bacterium]|nr:dihydrolipoyl dehydrogenase [Clostridiales bacterium]